MVFTSCNILLWIYLNFFLLWFAHISFNRKLSRRLQPKRCVRWTHRWKSPLIKTVWTLPVRPCTTTASSRAWTVWLQPSIMWKPVSKPKLYKETALYETHFSLLKWPNPYFWFPGVYLDSRCVLHQKPMLEGGTLGSKGHTLVVVPHLTEPYGPAKSSSSNAIPLCTLKNFPHRIEHTLQVQALFVFLHVSIIVRTDMNVTESCSVFFYSSGQGTSLKACLNKRLKMWIASWGKTLDDILHFLIKPDWKSLSLFINKKKSLVGFFKLKNGYANIQYYSVSITCLEHA